MRNRAQESCSRQESKHTGMNEDEDGREGISGRTRIPSGLESSPRKRATWPLRFREIPREKNRCVSFSTRDRYFIPAGFTISTTLSILNIIFFYPISFSILQKFSQTSSIFFTNHPLLELFPQRYIFLLVRSEKLSSNNPRD